MSEEEHKAIFGEVVSASSDVKRIEGELARVKAALAGGPKLGRPGCPECQGSGFAPDADDEACVTCGGWLTEHVPEPPEPKHVPVYVDCCGCDKRIEWPRQRCADCEDQRGAEWYAEDPEAKRGRL